jgi:hypothetical protein
VRIRLLTVLAGLISISMLAASPVGAASPVTRAQVLKAFLSDDDLGGKWRFSENGAGDGPSTGGCFASFAYAAVGLTREIERNHQYSNKPVFISQNIQVYGTADQAEDDFANGVEMFAGCTHYSVNGRTWKVVKLASPRYADQRAKYRVSGLLATKKGLVRVRTYLVATRHERFQTLVALTVRANGVTKGQQRAYTNRSTQVSRLATAKVARVLGR